MAHPVIDIQIEFIKEGLRRGEQRKRLMTTCFEKWPGTSERSFTRRFEAARKQLQSELSATTLRTEEEVMKEIKTRKIKILTALERMEILSKIARGEMLIQKPILVKGEIQFISAVPDWTDRKNAIAELNKMDGAYAPVEAHITHDRIIIFDIDTNQPLPNSE